MHSFYMQLLNNLSENFLHTQNKAFFKNRGEIDRQNGEDEGGLEQDTPLNRNRKETGGQYSRR